ncbi:MAG: hypothetical protein IH964_11635 [Candidatus Dadabacteria bacterium]|nr:hypothetical protein [Candidatus Dadabacteria bacterium]
MDSKKIPSVSLEAKLLTRAFDDRKRSLEQLEGLTPDVARLRVLKLAGVLIEEIHLLREKTAKGALDE